MNQKNVCRICSQNISHPVCGHCYSRHISYALNDLNIAIKDKMKIEARIKKIFKDSPNEDKCVICSKETTSICTYCCFLNVSRILSEFDVKDTNTFDIFNFQIDEDEMSKIHEFKMNSY